MLHKAFNKFHLVERPMTGSFIGGLASARTFTAVVLIVIGAGNSAFAGSSDDINRMLEAVSGQAVKLRKCYERSLFERTLSCQTKKELIESARRGCPFEETDLREAIIKSATVEQLASISSLTAGVLDAVRRPAEATISDKGYRDLPFDCLVKPISR